ncbi:hypothetical protein [Mycoplasmopsis pulmonis]|uniref:hypothetical protein n=1 Tax=Mycoplasmopsis pulmonis TaxID=2107 RepID=UPI0010051082|nr:hypothetical protein [Mycoplasmopsis pulmonis]VEU68275.1 Uncharacterised protein [Mycoplasmopsis pulmonis]
MKKINKKLTFVFALSLSILAPIALASCSSVAKAKQNDNKNQNLINNNSNKDSSKQDLETKNSDQSPKVSDPNTSNKEDEGSKAPQADNSNKNEGQMTNPQSSDSPKTPETPKGPSNQDKPQDKPNTNENSMTSPENSDSPKTPDKTKNPETPKDSGKSESEKTLENQSKEPKVPETPKQENPSDPQKNMDNSNSLENPKNDNLTKEKQGKIIDALKAHQISFIDKDFMNNPDISDYKLGQFNLNLAGEKPKITDNSFTFKASKIVQDLEKDVDISISLEKVTENEVSKKRTATFKIVAQGYEDISKTLEWSYKTNQEFLNEVVKDGEIYKNLQRQVAENIDETKKRSQMIPLELQKLNHSFKTIPLKYLIKADFLKYHIIDDENGKAHLKFKISRGSSNKEITLVIDGFAKVGILDKDYSGTLRNQKFDVIASSFWKDIFHQYPTSSVFRHYNSGYYWLADSADEQPWLQMSFKDDAQGLIYGFELLFYKNPKYYKPNSYVVEYQEAANGEWKTIDNPEIWPKTTNEDFKRGLVREHVIIKKDKIHAIRIKFVNKPYYSSIVSLNPIVAQQN